MEGVEIRTATISDLAVLRAFEQGLIAAERPFSPLLKPDPITYYHLEDMLTDPDVVFVLGVVDGSPVACGYARIGKAKDYYTPEQQAYLGMMYVEPGYRGRGINALVLDALKKRVQERGVTELCLEVFSSNEPALRAYEKAGFEPHILEMRMRLD